MKSYTIRRITLWFRDTSTNEMEELAELSLRKNQSVRSLIEDETIQGMLEYHITYTDDTTQVIEHDVKAVEDYRDEYPLLLAFVERYKNIIEWRSGNDFRTNQQIEKNERGHRIAYGQIHSMGFILSLLLEGDLLNSFTLIEEGYYYDSLFERWIEVEASRKALAPLILDVLYLEGLKQNSRAIQQIDITFEEKQTGLHMPLSECLSNYGSVDFYETTSIEGTIHMRVQYEGGSEQTISSDKSDQFDDRGATFVDAFLHYWQLMYEYDQKRNFWTNEPFLCYSSFYDYALISFTEDQWEMAGGKSRDVFEARFGNEGYDASQSSEEQFRLTHDEGIAGVLAELQDGLYFDWYLDRWVNVNDSYQAVRQFALDLKQEC